MPDVETECLSEAVQPIAQVIQVELRAALGSLPLTGFEPESVIASSFVKIRRSEEKLPELRFSMDFGDALDRIDGDTLNWMDH